MTYMPHLTVELHNHSNSTNQPHLRCKVTKNKQYTQILWVEISIKIATNQYSICRYKF